MTFKLITILNHDISKKIKLKWSAYKYKKSRKREKNKEHQRHTKGLIMPSLVLLKKFQRKKSTNIKNNY